MATAVDTVRTEPITFPLVSTLPTSIRRRHRRNWTKRALAIGSICRGSAVAWWNRGGNGIRRTQAPTRQCRCNADWYKRASRRTGHACVVRSGRRTGRQSSSGNIKALYADFNTKVTKGQLVGLIDPELFQTQVDQAQAGFLGSAQSAVIAAGTQVQKANSDLSGTVAGEKSAEAVIAKDRATALNARNQWTRLDGLYKQGVFSKEDDDLAKATTDAADAQVAADQAQIDASQQTIQSAQDQVRVTQAQLGSAKDQQRRASAVLDQAKINLAHTRITAPVDGTVIARRMDVGQTAAASFAAPTVFEIAQDLTKMQLDTNVDESDVGNITSRPDRNLYRGCLPGNDIPGPGYLMFRQGADHYTKRRNLRCRHGRFQS